MPKRRPSRAPVRATASHAPARPRWSIWWPLASLLLAGTLVYAGSLSYPLIFDDQVSIVGNLSIRDLWSPHVLNADRETPASGRPLVNVSHALNYAAGELDPRGYRLYNLFVHLLCAILVFAVVRRTLAMPRVPARVAHDATAIASISALLWTVHPLNTEVVAYVTQRSESMMAACYLFALYAAARAIESQGTRRWGLAAIGICALGMACKESMATAPVAVYLYDRTFVFGSWSAALRARWRLYAGLAATWLLLAMLIWSGPRIHSAGFATDVSTWTYLLNQAAIVPRYLRQSIWPAGLVVAYGPPLPLTLGAVLPSALFMAGLVAATLLALVQWPLDHMERPTSALQ